MQTSIDHITITTPSLEIGAKLVEDSLGITPQKGGEHPKMGTHNLFLRLGNDVFLEVIACNPKGAKPNRPRWFALDMLKRDSLAKLRTWVVRTTDIETTVANCSERVGEIESMSRGETNWLITIPSDGSLPVNGGAPAFIQWQVKEHPARKLEDFGLSLLKLQIYHPEPEKIKNLLYSINLNEQVEIFQGNEVKLVAQINTPKGKRQISA